MDMFLCLPSLGVFGGDNMLCAQGFGADLARHKLALDAKEKVMAMPKYNKEKALREIYELAKERGSLTIDDVLARFGCAYTTAMYWMREVAARHPDELMYSRGVLYARRRD